MPEMRRARSHVGMLQEDNTLSRRICEGYRPAEGFPHLNSHWGGAPLTENPWLKNFADNVAADGLTAKEWRMLEQALRKPDRCSLIELLYLYTAPQSTLVEIERDGNHDIKVALDSIIPAYDDLLKKLKKLTRSVASVPTPHYLVFAKEARDLKAHRTFAAQLRDSAAAWGSRKTKSREWYLYLMASAMERATGTQQIPALSLLIEAAIQAQDQETKPPQDEETNPIDEKSLEKRILRFRNRYGFEHELRSAPYSPAEAAEQIDAQTEMDFAVQTLTKDIDVRRLIEQIGVQALIKQIRQIGLPAFIKQIKPIGAKTDND